MKYVVIFLLLLASCGGDGCQPVLSTEILATCTLVCGSRGVQMVTSMTCMCHGAARDGGVR